MKKLSMLLCLVFLFTLLCPIAASAESNTPTYEELVDLACEAFPEYENNLRNGPDANIAICSENDPIVVKETRNISDDTSITYQQYASGRSLTLYRFTWDVTSTSSTSTSKTVTGELFVNCNTSYEVFNVSSFKYKINYNGYDSIIRPSGGFSGNSSCDVVEDGYRLTETSSASAFVMYRVTFSSTLDDGYYDPTPYTTVVTLNVGDDCLTIEAGTASETYY